MSTASEIEHFEVAPGLKICRILNGMWQVAGGHGFIDSDTAVEEMMKYHDAGFTTWDLADIYGPAEDFISRFRNRLADRREGEIHKSQALTKWVPEPRPISREFARASIDKSLKRMNTESIDLVQFHWWDYNNPYFIDALKYLSDLRDEDKLKHVGLTNFDTERMELIMKDGGVRIVSNQVQYSVIDRRPEQKMVGFCKNNNASILAYGTLCGGLVSEKYLGKPEPGQAELDTLSLKKYKRMIDQWGGWDLFQELLSTLNEIAHDHGVSISNVATRYILDRPAVAGVIIGTRLGIAQHRTDNSCVFQLHLARRDTDAIESILREENNLFELIGDCGDEYRN